MRASHVAEQVIRLVEQDRRALDLVMGSDVRSSDAYALARMVLREIGRVRPEAPNAGC
jgi:hypothetical protein